VQNCSEKLVALNKEWCFYGLFILIFCLSCTKKPLDFIEKNSINKVYSLDTIFAIACDPHIPENCGANDKNVNIRIRNLSLFEICNFEYVSVDNPFNFGSLMPGELSCYIPVDSAYGFPLMVNFQIEDRILSNYFAIDFTGDKTLPPGNFTFNFSILNTDGRKLVGGDFDDSGNDRIELTSNIENCRSTVELNCASMTGLDNETYLRIINSSILGICNFNVNTEFGNSFRFGNILPGDSTCYLLLDDNRNGKHRFNFGVANVYFQGLLQSPFAEDGHISGGKYTFYVSPGDLKGDFVLSSYRKDE